MSDAAAVKSFLIITYIKYGCLAGTGTEHMLKTNLPPTCPSHLGYDGLSHGRYLPTRGFGA